MKPMNPLRPKMLQLGGCVAAVGLAVLAIVAINPVVSAEGASAAPAPPPPSAKPHVIGSKDSAKWSETTVKSAATPANQSVLAAGVPTTVSGELVEVSCYLQLGKKGDAHIPCGSDCIRNGQPAGILDASGALTILFVEEHDPRRKGEIDVKEKLASLVAKQVTASGMLTATKDGYRALYISGKDIQAAP